MKIYLRNLFLVLTLAISNVVMAQKLYWVGGSGQFNDAAHWSYTSNGQGGAKTPTISDDVYFDENSFKSSSVINIIGGASCRDIIFSDYTLPVILNGTSNEKLTIAGNAAFNLYVTNQFLGDVWFNSVQQNNLKIGFGTFLGNVYFDGGGSWNLNSILNTDKQKTVTISSGNLNVNNNFLGFGNLICNANGYLKLNNSKIFIYEKIIVSNSSQIQGLGISKILFDYSLNPNHFPNVLNENNANLKTASTTTVTGIVPPTCNGFCDGHADVINL